MAREVTSNDDQFVRNMADGRRLLDAVQSEAITFVLVLQNQQVKSAKSTQNNNVFTHTHIRSKTS